jgi:small subunit ribosomal protein S21
MNKLHGRSVIVTDGNIEKALRKFKKKMQSSRVLDDLRLKEHYVKPTTQRKIKKSAAKNRWRKQLADQALPKKLY